MPKILYVEGRPKEEILWLIRPFFGPLREYSSTYNAARDLARMFRAYKKMDADLVKQGVFPEIMFREPRIVVDLGYATTAEQIRERLYPIIEEFGTKPSVEEL